MVNKPRHHVMDWHDMSCEVHVLIDRIDGLKREIDGLKREIDGLNAMCAALKLKAMCAALKMNAMCAALKTRYLTL